MLANNHAFSGFSVNDLAAAKKFYGQTLGLKVEAQAMGLQLTVGGGHQIFVYEKPNHQPATFTILNFVVDDIDTAVKDLKAKGVKFEHYKDMTDKYNIARGRKYKQGPDIAWFTDPAGNILSVLH